MGGSACLAILISPLTSGPGPAGGSGPRGRRLSLGQGTVFGSERLPHLCTSSNGVPSPRAAHVQKGRDHMDPNPSTLTPQYPIQCTNQMQNSGIAKIDTGQVAPMELRIPGDPIRPPWQTGPPQFTIQILFDAAVC